MSTLLVFSSWQVAIRRRLNYELAVWAFGDKTFHSNCVREIIFEEPDVRSWNYPIFSSGKYNEIILRAATETFLHDSFVNRFLVVLSSDTNVQLFGKLLNHVILEMIEGLS